MIANGIHKWPQPVGLADSAVGSQRPYHPSKSFLLQIVHRLGGQKPRSQLDLNQLGEIGNKMLFRGSISFPEPANVGFVKRKEFQHFPRSVGKYSRDAPA